MTSLKQIEANRRNAGKSTGPITREGKLQSRCNAVRHGLTAETVIGALEDAEDYQTFETAITADYDAPSAVERELVLRLASVLWRLRRATTMETGLFAIEMDRISDLERRHQRNPIDREVVLALVGPTKSAGASDAGSSVNAKGDRIAVDPNHDLARCFMRLADLPNFALDRLSRYEAILWRQVRQLILALDCLDRRKPQERRHRLAADGYHQLTPRSDGDF